MTQARTVWLNVSVLSPGLTPRTVEPLSGTFTFTGHAPAQARTGRLSVSVLSPTYKLPVGSFQKFRDKSALIYGKIQTLVDVAENLSGVNAVAALNLVFEDSISSETQEFSNKFSGRSAVVSINNVVRKVTFETLFPVLDATVIPVSEESLPLISWFKACGVSAEIVDNDLTLTNETFSAERLTVEIQQLPDNDPANQNSYKVLNAVGMVGLDLTVSKLGKLFFTFLGNPELPVYRERYITDFGSQKLNLLGTIRPNTVVSSTLTDLETETVTSFCFFKIQTDNLFGFEPEQNQLSCGEHFQSVPKPTPLAITIPLGTNNSVLKNTPEYCLGRRYSLKAIFGSAQSPIILEMSELQLADYKKIAADDLVGVVMGFLNTGFTKLTFTGPATP